MVTRKEFLENQKKIEAPFFMPDDGICYRCRKDIIPSLIEAGNDGTRHVTGCPLCYRSYCD